MKENHTNFQAKTYGTIMENVPFYMLHLTLKVTWTSPAHVWSKKKSYKT